ncbi:hypothetical protein V5799_013697 [Amblyomma americanum]|uniref:Uncharacterized protein n=1 Tax=Amblyomma americanum TaxID=6943 RepID=A0AAQ4E561_AMBAM
MPQLLPKEGWVPLEAPDRSDRSLGCCEVGDLKVILAYCTSDYGNTVSSLFGNVSSFVSVLTKKEFGFLDARRRKLPISAV